MGRELCPLCQSSDGLAQYADGTYCFSCKTQTKFNNSRRCVADKCNLDIPENCNDSWPSEIHDYITQFIDTEILVINQQHIYWSSVRQRLVILAPMNNAAWMRSINQTPKWLFAGQRDFSWFYSHHTSPVVCIVEDVISALKCSNFCNVVCLGGTRLSNYDRQALQPYSKVLLFLDGDQAGKDSARKIRQELKLTHECVMIRNRRDPKNHSNEELRMILQ